MILMTVHNVHIKLWRSVTPWMGVGVISKGANMEEFPMVRHDPRTDRTVCISCRVTQNFHDCVDKPSISVLQGVMHTRMPNTGLKFVTVELLH